MAQQLGVGPHFGGPRLKSQDPYDSSQPSTILVRCKALSGPQTLHTTDICRQNTIHITTQPQTNILCSQENRDQKNTKRT